MLVVILVGTREQISVNSLLALRHTKRRLLSFLPQIQPLGPNRGHFGPEGAGQLQFFPVVFEDVTSVLTSAGTQERISVNSLPARGQASSGGSIGFAKEIVLDDLNQSHNML